MKLGEAIRVVRSVRPHHARTFAKTVVPEVVRPARIIWNQAIGAIFLLFAVSFFSYAATHTANPAGLMFSIFLGCVMGYFSISSFVRARNVGRR